MRKRNVPTFADGYYRCIADPTAMMHLRQNDAFREIARYAGNGMVNPMQPELAPNATFFRGMGPAYGQAGFVAGQPVMPKQVGPAAREFCSKQGELLEPLH